LQKKSINDVSKLVSNNKKLCNKNVEICKSDKILQFCQMLGKMFENVLPDFQYAPGS